MLYDGLDMVGVFHPVSPDAIAALPDALAAHVAEPAGKPLWRRPARRRRWGHRRVGAVSLARGCVVIHPGPMGPAELALTAQRRGYVGLPIAIHVAGDTVAVMLPHDLFDGASGWDQVERIVQHATATPRGEQPPRLAFPVAASLRHSGLLRGAAQSEVRATRRAAERGTTVAPQADPPLLIDDQRRVDGLHTVWIDAGQRQRLLGALQPSDEATGRPRQTLHMRLTGLVLEAVAEAVEPGLDLRVRMNIDARRYAPPGRQVLGPFATPYPVGTLRTIDTNPSALGAELKGVLDSRAPLWAVVANLVGYVRGRVRHPLTGPPVAPGRSSFDLGISILPARLPASFWAAGDPTNAVLLLHPRQPSDPYVQIAQVQGGVVITLWDETGLVDADVFVGSLRARIGD